MTIVEIAVQLYLFSKSVLLNSFSFSVFPININILECTLVNFPFEISGTHNFHVSELKDTYSSQSFRNLLVSVGGTSLATKNIGYFQY